MTETKMILQRRERAAPGIFECLLAEGQLFVSILVWLTWHVIELFLNLIPPLRLGNVSDKQASFRLANVNFEAILGLPDFVVIELKSGWNSKVIRLELNSKILKISYKIF